MLARRLTTLRPAMPLAEAGDTTRLYGVAGRTSGRTALVTARPCRAPYHTVSDAGRSGGGRVPVPDGGSRVCQGMPFLDKLPEVKRHTLAGLVARVQPATGLSARSLSR